jgi:hypothetical protein
MAQTNAQFLTEKLTNYKKFISDNSSDKEKVKTLDLYDLNAFMVFGSQSLLPLSQTEKGLDIAVQKTVEHFSLNDTPEVRSKCGRYYQFLVDFLSQPTSE